MKELPPTIGTSLSHYRILSRLGAGGMGEVYLAEDTRLDRKVALKILPDDSAANHKRMRRFFQEAKLASSLSHPNICVIHEVSTTEDDIPFIAMEYVEGQTLAERIKTRPPSASEILDLSIQVADALDEAHSKGVTHRDIKPANIMITHRGKVKVLDFGLAKVVATGGPFTVSDITTQANTDPGLLMGTVQYMSPEQALGRDVDHRSDIFSLGVVLYEMATGRLPFHGATASETIDKIIHAQPEAIARFNYNIPEELERIIRKALRKDAEARYQTVKDLLVDLRNLHQEVELEALLERSVSPSSSGSVRLTTGSGQTAVETDSRQTLSATDTRGVLSTSANSVAAKIKPRSPGARIWIAAIAVAAIAAGFSLYKFLSKEKPVAPFQTTKITKLTTNGNAIGAAISPDGKYVAYVMSEAGKHSLWVSQVAISSNVRLIAPGENRYWDLFFSPDSNYIYYGLAGPNAPAAIYQIPVLGGASKKALSDPFTQIRFSPDGKQIAFLRGNGVKKEVELTVANSDGTGEQVLVTRSVPYWIGVPAWSPDGKIIACPVSGADENGTYVNILEVRIASRTEKLISQKKWQEVDSVAWLSDGAGLVITAKDYESSFSQVWALSYPDGEARKITNDLSDYGGLSLTADSSAMLVVQGQRLANIWTAASGAARRPTQTTMGAGRYFDLSWTPDGHLLYASDASGSADLWEMNADGSGAKQLTSGAGRNYGPAASPDGRYIFFHSNRSGTWHIWRIDRDGSNPKQLTFDSNDDTWAQCSPDGRWVIYQHNGSDSMMTVWKVPVDGGEPVRLTDMASMRPTISPDGTMFACWYWNEQTDSPPHIVLFPFEGGPPIKMLDIPPGLLLSWAAILQWAPDGRALTYVDNRSGVDNIWSQPIDGSKPVVLTDFKSDRIESFNWSRDGKLACSRGVITNDVVLIRDAK